jgi:hypothetical protein
MRGAVPGPAEQVVAAPGSHLGWAGWAGLASQRAAAPRPHSGRVPGRLGRAGRPLPCWQAALEAP